MSHAESIFYAYGATFLAVALLALWQRLDYARLKRALMGLGAPLDARESDNERRTSP